jgi:hypothetical protein
MVDGKHVVHLHWKSLSLMAPLLCLTLFDRED